ncbi:energy-coupling factor transporter transmembrane component T family protein [Paenibacillus sp. GCM10023252]|uniref:energy-coupling factor transporter transmembrane component T family protein n=1 Tax=Paenibacillus sp. GCM10023252 TaxID=3252649 RepID=UPI00361A2AF4
MTSTIITHPPLRIAGAILAIAAGVSIEGVGTLLYLLAWGALWLAAFRVPFSSFWRRVRLLAPFFLFSVIFFSLYGGAPYYMEAGPLTLSVSGVEQGLRYSCRLLFSLMMITLMLHGLPLSVFVQSLIRLKLPALLSELILFTLRYMEVIRDEAFRLLRALRSRGMHVRSFYSISYYRMLSSLLGSLLARSLHRSDRVYSGMLARGYRGQMVTGELAPAAWRDWLLMLLLVVPVYVLLLLQII